MTVRGRLTLIAAFAAAICGAIAAATWSQYLTIQALEAHLAARRSIATGDRPFGELLNQSQDLGLLITLAMTGLAVLILLSGYVVRRAVLLPLVDLAQQLRRVAREGVSAKPIVIQGPAEITDVARDAEIMRRALQTQARAAQAAEIGLHQQAPLVTAIRDHLSTGVDQVGPVLVASTVQPARGVIGGDWWQVLPWPDRGAAVLVGDVIGHGEQAALMAYALRTALTGALVSGVPASELPHLGCQVLRGCRGTRDQLAFATFAVILFDAAAETISWLNAGHPAPLIASSDGALRDCDPTGPWLSTYGGTWSVTSQRVTQQDVVVAFTDGLTADHPPADGSLGDLGLRNAVRTSVEHWFTSGASGVALGRLVTELRDAVCTGDNGPQRDDLALIALTSHT